MRIIGYILLILFIITLISSRLEKNIEKKKKYNKNFYMGMIIFIAISLVMILAGSRNSNNATSLVINKNDIITNTKVGIQSIIGVTKDSKSEKIGITTIVYDNNQYIINYNFLPFKSSDIKQEIGIYLSDDIDKIYKQYNNVDKLKFSISKLVQDSYGNKKWVPYIEFNFNRGLYKKINWDNFDGTKLIDIANNK